jgi:hypothetical protein
MNKSFALGLVCVCLAACAPALRIEPAKVGSAERVVCERATPTGSIMPKKKCTTAAEREEQRKQAQAALEDERQRQLGDEITERLMRERSGSL